MLLVSCTSMNTSITWFWFTELKTTVTLRIECQCSWGNIYPCRYSLFIIKMQSLKIWHETYNSEMESTIRRKWIGLKERQLLVCLIWGKDITDWLHSSVQTHTFHICFKQSAWIASRGLISTSVAWTYV